MLFHISKENTYNYSDLAIAESTGEGKQSERKGKRIIFPKSVTQLCNCLCNSLKHVFSNTALCSCLSHHYCENRATRTNTKWADPTGNTKLLEGAFGGAKTEQVLVKLMPLLQTIL